jgi:hypothetical protein
MVLLVSLLSAILVVSLKKSDTTNCTSNNIKICKNQLINTDNINTSWTMVLRDTMYEWKNYNLVNFCTLQKKCGPKDPKDPKEPKEPKEPTDFNYVLQNTRNKCMYINNMKKLEFDLINSFIGDKKTDTVAFKYDPSVSAYISTSKFKSRNQLAIFPTECNIEDKLKLLDNMKKS